MASGANRQEEQKSRIYADILARIVGGEFLPGERLIEEDLARVYRVSRTPIREILFILEKDGLIEHVRNRGARVVSFTPDDVEQIYEVRKALECRAIRGTAQNIRLEDLLEIEQRLQAANSHERGHKWNQEQVDLDLDLHRLIVLHSGNRWLISCLESVSLMIHSLRLLGYRNEDHARQTGEDHLAIVRALLRRDADLAERLLAAHIDTSKRNAIELFYRKNQKIATSNGLGGVRSIRQGLGVT